MGISQLELQQVEVTFRMKIERRNIATAESGIAFRWVHPFGGDAAGGAGRTNLLSTELSHLTGDEFGSGSSFTGGGTPIPFAAPYRYYQPLTAHIAVKLRPQDCMQVVQYRRFQNPRDAQWNYPWWYAPWEEDGACTLNEVGYASDGHTYVHAALRGGNHVLALALVRNVLLQPGARGRFMPLLSHHAALANGAPYRNFLDSLAGAWTGNERASVHRARMPYLLAGRHWSEARDAIGSMASASVVPADAIARYALFVQASDSATRREFVANFFVNGSLAYPDSSISKLVSALWYAPVGSDVPYVFQKTSTEIETSPVPSSILTVFPNPAPGRDAVVRVQFRGAPQGELIVTTLLGIEEQRLVIQDPNNSGTATVTLGPLPAGVHLLQWHAGGASVFTILHVLN